MIAQRLVTRFLFIIDCVQAANLENKDHIPIGEKEGGPKLVGENYCSEEKSRGKY